MPSSITIAELLAKTEEHVRRRTARPETAVRLRSVAASLAPRLPARFETPAQLSRFKRAQREFDRVLLELRLASPQEIQTRNSVALSRTEVRLVDLAAAHAPAL